MLLKASERCFFLLTPTNSDYLRTPARCHFNLDTNYYPELAPDSIGLGAQYHGTALTSDTHLKYWVPRLLTLLFNLATNSSGVPTTPLLRFNYKGYNSGTTQMEEIRRAR